MLPKKRALRAVPKPPTMAPLKIKPPGTNPAREAYKATMGKAYNAAKIIGKYK